MSSRSLKPRTCVIGHGALPLPYRTFLEVKEEVVVVSMLVRNHVRVSYAKRGSVRERRETKNARLELTTRALKWNMTGARRKRGFILSGFYGCFGVE